MTDRLASLTDLTGTRPWQPSLYELRVLERHLRARAAGIDARLDTLLELDVGGLPLLEHVAEVDVLCAALAEVREVLAEVRAEADLLTGRTAARRPASRRWA